MTVTYRDATVADAAALDSIFDTSFCDTFGHIYDPKDLDMFLNSFGIADWEEHLRNPIFACRIAEMDGERVGYIKLGPVKIPVETDLPAMLLDQLYVLKEHHGAGIAQSLGLGLVAEGVETEAQRQFLLRLGVPTGQGFLFAPGLTPDEFALRLQRQAEAASA